MTEDYQIIVLLAPPLDKSGQMSSILKCLAVQVAHTTVIYSVDFDLMLRESSIKIALFDDVHLTTTLKWQSFQH